MRYCEKCGFVMDELATERNKQNCPICSGVWSEDDMTAIKYSELSESEKDTYDEQLLNLIKNSPKFDKSAHRNCSTKDGGFWYGFRVEKMSRIDPDFPQKRLAEIYEERKSNEPFKPFPQIDTVKARKVAERAEIVSKKIESGYYSQNTSKQENIPHCPTCNSTNVKSISGLNHGVSVAMLGIFSKKINKSFECKNCGYTW